MSCACRVCGAAGDHTPFELREQMFGLGDRFAYFACRECGCLQIQQAPSDWPRYYPPHYYSFNVAAVPQRGPKAWLAACRDRAVVTQRGGLGRLLAQLEPPRPDVASLGLLPLRRTDRILDVGCGRGMLLSALHRAGFRRLAGCDPFLPGDVEVLPGLWVRRQPLEAVSESFEVIMLHHVLEHIEGQQATLVACRDRLAPTGRLLVRIPTIEGEAWRRYGVHAVQLDAPRHLFLHTRRSFERLARNAGLRLERLVCDSTEFQFWASELYRRGVPLMNPDGRQTDPAAHFTRTQLAEFKREAARLNRAGQGDQFVALLTHASPPA